MSSTVAHRVMDHGDQQKVHPFFGTFTKSCNTPDSVPSIPSHETTTIGSVQSPAEHQATATKNLEQDSQQLDNEPGLSENILEDDPNAERRKRLKISLHVAPREGETEEPNVALSTESLISTFSGPATVGPRDITSNDLDTEEGRPKRRTSPPRKILKLNANGKLLSSPITQSSENSVNKVGREKRRRNPKRNDTKIVIIKYEKNSTIGKRIDDIISGRNRHSATLHTAPQKLHATSDFSQPPKATHPFFLGNKSASKLSQEVPSTTTRLLDQKDSASCDTQLSSSAKGTFSNSLFAKIPDSIPPLWPPKDLVHVRGLEHHESQTSTSMIYGDRKSKQRVLNIDEAENILNNESERIWNEAQSLMTKPNPSLRIPGRSVVSGSTLQMGMNSQLSCGDDSISRNRPGYQGEAGRAHPCIAKLYTTIATSVTSFDSGKLDSVQWTQKYSPTCAEDVIQPGPEARMLRDWLKNLMVSTVDSGNVASGSKKKTSASRKAKRRKTTDKLDGFIISSEEEASEMDELVDSDEDELACGVTVSSKRTVIRVGDSVGKFKKGDKSRMTNAVLISGPSGCGKSASVYAVAKELNFEIFEINSGTRRSAKDILERVGDMTQNHLVHLGEKAEESDNDNRPAGLAALDSKQNPVNMFFKSAAQKNQKHSQDSQRVNMSNSSSQDTSNSSSRAHKQSLILLEEVDVLFEEDKQFWIGVLALIEQSKRPVIMTCNHEDLVPIQDLSLHAILRYHAPSPDLAVDYLLLIAANEGHMLKRAAVNDLYLASNQDLRKSIIDLSFWCQMAVGSQKSGIDWIIDRWPEGSDIDINGNSLKVISLQTYQHCMGWFNRDFELASKGLAKESELLLESRNWWQLDFEMDYGDSWWLDYLAQRDQNKSCIDQLHDVMTLADSRSALDLLSNAWSLDQKEDDLDTTLIDITDKERSNYQAGYSLLVANHKTDYTGVSADLGSTANALMRRITLNADSLQDDSLTTNRVLAKQSHTKPIFSYIDYLDALEPVLQARHLYPPQTGRLAPLFENCVPVIAEDIAPYIRSIMAYDLRLERYRDALNGTMSQGSTKRKTRTTKASRAALEGGNKSDTRRERWFTTDVNPNRILATGSKGWEDALVQEGFLNVFPAMPESQASIHTDSDSSQSTETERSRPITAG